MYFPGLEGEKPSEMTEEQVLKKLGELQKRMAIAQQMGNSDVIRQLRNLLDYYYSIQDEKRQQELQEMIDKDPKLGRTSIDIDWPDPADEDEDDSK